MSKKEKKVRKSKGEGRKPTLAPFVDHPFPIYMNCDGKEREAMVLSSGIIKYKEKEFTSPSGFANAVIKELGAKGRADGWKSVYFNKDGERVMLNVLRGKESPLKIETPNADKPQRKRAPRKAKKRNSAKATSAKNNSAAAGAQTAEAAA